MAIILDGTDAVGDLGDALAARAPLASPTFTGTPAAPTAATGTSTTQIATTAFVADAANNTQINAQTGTTYTLVLADNGKLVTCNNAAAITLTVPPQSSVTWPTGATISAAQLGAGQVTIAAGAGVTLRYSPGLKIASQYQSATLVRLASDEWLVTGALVS